MKLRILAVLVVLAAASSAFAQANNGGNNGRANRGNRGNGQQGRQQFDQRLKDQLGVSDDEWNVLQPRIDKVRQLERDARSRGARNGRNGRNGRGNRNRDPNQNADATANSDRPTSEVQQKAQALQKLLDGKDSNPDAIKAAVTDLREAKVKARVDLKKAQDDLRDLLTARQESVLVMAGILE